MTDDNRLSSGHQIDHEAHDHALRPKTLVDFIGQGWGVKILKCLSRRRASAQRLWIIYCFTARPVLVKPPWHKSSHQNWHRLSCDLRSCHRTGR